MVVQAQPNRLFLIADGPTLGSNLDATKVAEARRVVEDVCFEAGLEVRTNYSSENLGLRRRVETGLDWAFEEVDSLVILEDDCLVDSTFFPFCAEMLNMYRNYPSVGRISAQSKWVARDSLLSYEFVQSSGIWGWATWQDRWRAFRSWSDCHPKLRTRDLFRDIWLTRGLFRKIVRIKLLSSKANLDSWGVRLSVYMKLNGLVGISPRVNLVTNTGFGEDATNTKSENLPGPKSNSLHMPLVHPLGIFVDVARERAGSRAESVEFVIHAVRRIRELMKGKKNA